MAVRRLEPSGKPLRQTRPPGKLGTLMTLMEGTYADAKSALIFDEVETAKNTAYVLSELARLTSHYRKDANWSDRAARLSAAALQVAQSRSLDAKTVRQQLRGVYKRCESCHNRNR